MIETPGNGPAEADDRLDAALLTLLLDEPWPLSHEELTTALGEGPGVEDALARLEGLGLVHRLEQFVFPTRAARRWRDLIDGDS
jgi:hypothetical protein